MQNRQIQEDRGQDKLVIALVRDYYFGGAQLDQWVQWAGYKYRRFDASGELIRALGTARAGLVIVDLRLESDRIGLAEIAYRAGESRLIAFGPVADVESRHAAEEAGFHEVMPNINFHRRVPVLLARHLPLDPTLEYKAPNAERLSTNGHAVGWRRLLPHKRS